MVGTRRERERDGTTNRYGEGQGSDGPAETNPKTQTQKTNTAAQPETVTTYTVGAKRAPNAAPAPNKPLIRP